MSEQSRRLSVSIENGVMIVELADRKILDEVNITQIGQELKELVAGAEKPKIVVDFASVSHMSSSALGVLITLHKRIREKKGQLRLGNVQPTIYEVFVITRLNEIFTICPSRQGALESFE